MRELEEKFKNQEIQLKNQFDGIVKLNEKIKVLKEKKGIKVEDSKQTPKDQPISEEVKEKIEKLEKSIEVLQHSKISEAKAMLFTKIMNERKIKELQEKVAALENEIKEKNKENQLSSIKIKDIIRAKLSINPKKVLLPELNNSIVNDMNNKVSFPSSGTQNNDSDSNRRSKSIEPLNSRESTKSKVDSNLASRLNRVKAPSKDFNTLINTTETNFESELEKASNAKLATVNDAVPKSRPGLPDLTQGKSALLNHAKQSISKRLNKGTKGYMFLHFGLKLQSKFFLL